MEDTMRIIKPLCLLILLISSMIHANQLTEKPLIIGQRHTLLSQSLNEQRDITVYLPNDYNRSQSSYPVLYILDGQKYFLHAVGLAQLFKHHRKTPDFIVVGIDSRYPQRFGHYSQKGAADFISFIDKDVISFIEKNYRTSNEKFLFGWEYAGAFAIELLTKMPQLFSAVFVASPFPLISHDDVHSDRVNMVQNWVTRNTDSSTWLYFTVGVNETLVRKGTDALHDVLTQQQAGQFKWSYEILKDEVHLSTPFSGLFHALTNYYHNYPELQFDNLDHFKKSGGMKFVKNYQQSRAHRFGFSPELSVWSQFTMIRNAIRADDLVQFNQFVDMFATASFFNELKVSRMIEVAQFHHNHHQYRAAMKIYQHVIRKSPNHKHALNQLSALEAMQAGASDEE